MAAMGWFALREPPGRVENYRLGAEGERKTEKQLRPLERADWTVTHDIECRYGNYDHVAVSRAGVFLLETKNLGGTIEISRGVPRIADKLLRTRSSSQPSIPRTARRRAQELKVQIERETGHAKWVQPVIVFWSEFPQGVVEEDNCVFIHGSRLRSWLECRPARLRPHEYDDIAAQVERLNQPGDSAAGSAAPEDALPASSAATETSRV